MPMVLLSRDFVSPFDVIGTTTTFFGGEIDLDPASSPHANKVVGATKYFTWRDNGLKQTWKAKNLYLYPPRDVLAGDEQPKETRLFQKTSRFKKSSQRVWLELAYEKWLRKEFDQAIIFITSSEVALLSTQRIGFDFPICILKERPKLLIDNKELNKVRSPKVFGFIFYLPSINNYQEATTHFSALYSTLGRVYI